jgi:hypothetical protein
VHFQTARIVHFGTASDIYTISRLNAIARLCYLPRGETIDVCRLILPLHILQKRPELQRKALAKAEIKMPGSQGHPLGKIMRPKWKANLESFGSVAKWYENGSSQAEAIVIM